MHKTIGKVFFVGGTISLGIVVFLVSGAIAPLVNSAIVTAFETCSHVSIAPAATLTPSSAQPLFTEPEKPSIIVNTYDNSFVLKRNGTVLRSGKCSTGSYILLKSPDKREWIFKTPRGRFSICAKVESPVWHRPDWAFIEDGLSVPPQGAPERNEEGVLGDYALHFGGGYMIHGTLYQRFLGLPVTHGCIRLGDDDLKIVYETLENGSYVFIY